MLSKPFEGEMPNTQLPLYLQPPVPSVFTFEITTRCQHRCIGCGNVFPHSREELNVTEWSAIIEKVRPHIKALRITGGEPTLHKQFSDLLSVVDSLGVPFVLFTNANWSKPESTVGLLRRCVNLRGILVSLHGADPIGYRKFTGMDSFSAVMENIRLAASAGLRVATNTLLLTTTLGHLPEIAQLAFSAGASTASFGRYYGQPLKNLSLTANQLKQALTQIAGLRRDDKRITVSNCVPSCFSPGEDFGGGGCTSGFTHCTVGPGGEVRPCTHSKEILGYLPAEDIREIWRSPQLASWRNLIPMDCRSCKALNVCRGACRAVAQQLDLSRDPLHTSALEEMDRNDVIEIGLLDSPKLSCSVEPTSYGYALAGVGQFITLSHQSGPIIQMLDGNTTVEQIMDEFGPVSLELIGSLLQKRLVELR